MHKSRKKLIHEGEYVAEVEVELIESEEGWSPYLSLDDAAKLDAVREALRREDLEAAGLRAGRGGWGSSDQPLHTTVDGRGRARPLVRLRACMVRGVEILSRHALSGL